MNNSTDCSCSLNELEFFEPINKQVVLDKAQWVDIYPLNNLSSNGPIEFNINGSTDELLDFNNTMLSLQVKIVNATGDANLINDDVVAPVNNWLHSCFSDVILTIGGTQVEGGNQTYPYKAYLMNLLTHNADSKKTQLMSSGWYKDTVGHMNSGAAANEGFTARKTLKGLSTTVDLCGPLLLDFFIQNKYCLHNVDIGIKLIPSKPEFQTMLLTAGGVANKAEALKIIYEKAVLFVRRVKAIPSLINGIEDKLNVQNALYPLQRTEVTTYTIPTGNTTHNKESLFRGQMPKLILVGFVRNDAYNGSYTQNPFHFQNFAIDQLALYREGEPIPFRPFTPNFAQNKFQREYTSLMQAINIYNRNEDIDLSPSEFKDGYTIFGFNLTPDLTVADHAQPIRDGNIRLEVRFSNALAQTVNVIVMGVFDARLEITKYRNVLMDWKA